MLHFPKTARILRSAEFRKVYDNGVRFSGPLFAAFCLKRVEAAPNIAEELPARVVPPLTGPRLGLTVPRAVGKAVDRNRIKRRLREAFRLLCIPENTNGAGIKGNWDIVLNPRKAVLTATYPEIEEAIRKVIIRCNK